MSEMACGWVRLQISQRGKVMELPTRPENYQCTQRDHEMDILKHPTPDRSGYYQWICPACGPTPQLLSIQAPR